MITLILLTRVYPHVLAKVEKINGILMGEFRGYEILMYLKRIRTRSWR